MVEGNNQLDVNNGIVSSLANVTVPSSGYKYSTREKGKSPIASGRVNSRDHYKKHAPPMGAIKPSYQGHVTTPVL